MNDYPDTPAKRRAGMAAFRARMLAAHERLARTLPDQRERAEQRSLADHIRRVQRKFGEVQPMKGTP